MLEPLLHEHPRCHDEKRARLLHAGPRRQEGKLRIGSSSRSSRGLEAAGEAEHVRARCCAGRSRSAPNTGMWRGPATSRRTLWPIAGNRCPKSSAGASRPPTSIPSGRKPARWPTVGRTPWRHASRRSKRSCRSRSWASTPTMEGIPELASGGLLQSAPCAGGFFTRSRAYRKNDNARHSLRAPESLPADRSRVAGRPTALPGLPQSLCSRAHHRTQTACCPASPGSPIGPLGCLKAQRPACSQTGSSGLAPAPEFFPSGSGCRYLALRVFMNKASQLAKGNKTILPQSVFFH